MDADVIVIGAGVIGLATAQKLAQEGQDVILLEKEDHFGMGVSSRNSEVIHGGIYYKTDSLKASLCVRGKTLLYEHCDKYNVNYKRRGKLFVAVTHEEIASLEKSLSQGIENGLEDLVLLTRQEVGELEPNLFCQGALLSPSTGVLDTHGFMKSLLKLGEEHNLTFAACSPVIGAQGIQGGWQVNVGGREPMSLTSRVVINAAGLFSTGLSHSVFPTRKVPKLHPTKGSYVKYSGKSPLNHIIYPALLPGVVTERVDGTPDFSGTLRFGPNVASAESLEDFSLAPNLVESMIPGIERYLPNLDETRLLPDFSGIRPKIYGKGDTPEDFRFEWAPEVGWLDLWGMESPALTSSLAIAEHVLHLIEEKSILH